jgi:hypothetical protein
MSPEFWLGVAGIVVTLTLAIGGGLIAHVRHDERRESRLTQVEREIGDHDSGIRGELHKQVNLLSRLRAVVYFIGRALKLDVMKDLDDDK